MRALREKRRNDIFIKTMTGAFMIYHRLTVIIGLIIISLFFGCSKDTSTNPTVITDQEAITQQITDIDSIADFSSSDEATIDDGAAQSWSSNLEKITTPITPLLWGRKVDNVQKTVTVIIDGDTIATATIRKMVTGRLIILARSADTTARLDTVQKQFTKEFKRQIRFIRVARNDDRVKNWKPTAITSVLGKTQLRDFNIASVELITPNDTIVMTDTLPQWFRLGAGTGTIPVVNEGDSIIIRLRLLSDNSNTEYAAVRHCVHHRFSYRYRVRMGVADSLINGDKYERQYEKRFAVRLPATVDIARYNAVVDVMSHNSINDDTEPFMNMVLGVPYIVKR
jgi:PBP1b-binding outer membrane lipoprotein LpoB